MKISQIDEGVLDIFKKGEGGQAKAGEKASAAASKSDALSGYKAPGSVNSPAPITFQNQGPKASPGAKTQDVKVTQTTKPAAPELSTKGERVPPQVQAQIDAKKAADAKAAKKAAATDAAGTKPDVSTATKTKKPPVSASGAVLATGAGIGIGAATQKKDSPDATKGGSATAGDATGDDTVGKSKNSPFYVPPDNASREYKPYPADSRYGKEDAAKAADAAKATSTQSSSGYKGSQGSQAIQALNPEIADVNKIRTGQELKMPDGSTYTVKKGDALDRIARNAGISPKTTPAEKPAAPTAKSEPAAPAAPTEPKVYTGAPASVDTRDGTGDNDKEDTPTRDYSSGRPVDKELDDKYGTGNTRTADDGRTYVRQKGVMGGPDSEQRSYASFGDFFNKIRGRGDVNGKVADEVQESSELNTIKKLSSITESKITQVDNNMDLRKLLAIMSETKMADLKGKKHGGSYGKEYDTDEEGEDKPAAKKSRGGQESDSTKDSKKWQGADDAADAIIGGKAPKKEVGTKSVKHSIKEWMQTVEESLLEDEEKSFVCVHAKKGKCEVKAKTSYEAAKKAADKWKMKSTAGIDTHRADKPIHVDEAELKGGQKKIDKNKNGKLDSEDFKMLRKNKVDEGVNLHKMMTEKQTKVDEMLEELQQEIAEFKTTGEMGDKLRDALDLHTYSKGETLIGEGDQELADKFHDEDMIRLGDEGKADAQHMKDLDRTRDESTADLWRMKDLARDSTMGRADAISLREDDHKEGDTVYHRGQIGIVDRIEGNKCFVHKPNGDMDVWPTEECSKKKQGAFDMFKKDVQDVGAGFGRFLKGKSELDESPFAFESKKAKVEEEDQPKLKTKMTDTGTETTSSTGRIKATFEPGKETKVEPVKESMAYDVWNHQLEKMINESLTVTTTKGDNGTDDSVSVTASGNDASEIMAILRNAGIGSMGNEEEHIDHPTSAYGAPEGESVGIVKIDGPEVVDGGDTMLDLMKKIADISNGNSEHQGHDSSDDYADENCEQEVDEGNAFTGALKDTPQGGEFEVDGKKYTDTSSLEEGNRMCSECGMNEGECGHKEMVDEDDVEDAKVGIAAGSPAIQAAEPAAPAQQNTAAPASAGGYAQSATAADNNPTLDPAASGRAPTNTSSYTGAAPAKAQDQNVDANATAQRDQLQKDVNAGKSVASTNIAPSQINPAVLGKQAGATTKATGKVSYAPNAGGVTKTASANPAQKLAAQNKAGSKIGQGYAQAALAEGPDIEFAEVGLEEDAEYANSDDDAALQDIKYMTNFISGGLNGQKTMHRHGYQNGDNPLAMRESTDPIAQWKKLSGLS